MKNPKIRSDLEPDLEILLAIVPTAPREKWVRDKILEIIDDDDFNSDGIEVLTKNGFYGHVKEIFEADDLEDIKKRISSREDHEIETKETFHFDVKENKKNNARNLDVVKAVVSFLNSDGGYVYIGIKDNGPPVGLERDYLVMGKDGNNDALERQIRDSLKSNLTNYSTVLQCTKKITFPIIDGIEICQIKVEPSTTPIFFKAENVIVESKGNRTSRKIDWFYIREGNRKHLVETMSSFYEHFQRKFHKNT